LTNRRESFSLCKANIAKNACSLFVMGNQA
jgi:hypothetical protein